MGGVIQDSEVAGWGEVVEGFGDYVGFFKTGGGVSRDPEGGK